MASTEVFPKLSMVCNKYTLIALVFFSLPANSSKASQSLTSSPSSVKSSLDAKSRSSALTRSSGSSIARRPAPLNSSRDSSESSHVAIVVTASENQIETSNTFYSSSEASLPLKDKTTLVTPSSNTSNTDKRPTWHWVITWIISGTAIALSLYNFLWARRSFEIQSRKSIYDDFWFREIFFKKLISELIDFRKKWDRRKCGKLTTLNKKEADKLIKEYLSDLAILRDIASSIEVLDPQSRGAIEAAIDMLDGMPYSNDPESLYSSALASIHMQAFKIHRDMEKNKYRFRDSEAGDKLTKL